MVDIVNKESRSRMMSGIRSSNTKPELLVRQFLHGFGYRYRLDSKVGATKPDIVLKSYNIAIFIHGCYWHQHSDCKLAYSDRAYSDSWVNKFEANKLRDQKVLTQLKKENWRVVIIWECVTRNTEILKCVMFELDNWIKNTDSNYFETEFRKI